MLFPTSDILLFASHLCLRISILVIMRINPIPPITPDSRIVESGPHQRYNMPNIAMIKPMIISAGAAAIAAIAALPPHFSILVIAAVHFLQVWLLLLLLLFLYRIYHFATTIPPTPSSSLVLSTISHTDK